MGDKTGIEWTDATWNPTTGCDRVGPGCDNCYALTQAKRLKAMGQANYQTDGDPRTSGPGFGLAVHEHMLGQPLRWRKPRRIFVNSMSDLFHKDVPDEFIARVFAVMAACQQHTFQVLTKRPHRMATLLSSDAFLQQMQRWYDIHDVDGGPELWESVGDAWPLPNVWLGVSIENDKYTWRADHLRDTPAVVRFISAEPLLGPLPSLDLTGVDWLIVGGESGAGARPMHPDWLRDLRDRRATTGTGFAAPAFFFKQWGEWGRPLPDHFPRDDNDDRFILNCSMGGIKQWFRTPCSYCAPMERVGKHAAGRSLDGREWSEYPHIKGEVDVAS